MSEILLDDRAGSGDLASYLAQWDIPHTLTRLPFGDAAVEANGPIDPPVVGIEIKKIRDALQCMRDGRFAGHQLPGMWREYGVCWLVIEGVYSVDYASGAMIVPGKKDRKRTLLTLGRESRSGFLYKEFDHWLTTLEVKAGLHVRRTSNRVETARFHADMASWWERQWDKHKSHLAMHTLQPDAAMLVPASVMRKVAAQLPGVGWARSAEIEKYFGTIEKMVKAPQVEWTKIDGIGKGLANTIVSAIRGVGK